MHERKWDMWKEKRKKERRTEESGSGRSIIRFSQNALPHLKSIRAFFVNKTMPIMKGEREKCHSDVANLDISEVRLCAFFSDRASFDGRKLSVAKGKCRNLLRRRKIYDIHKVAAARFFAYTVELDKKCHQINKLRKLKSPSICVFLPFII